jgi:SAM-dependent methyltransferase
MNRKERRATHRQHSTSPTIDDYTQALAAQQSGRLDEAARTYKRHLLAHPDHAEAVNNLGVVLQAQGKTAEASSRFAQALTLMPQLLDAFSGIAATLAATQPPLAQASRRANAAWPNRLSADQLFDAGGLEAIAQDPLLLCVLQTVPVRDVALEQTFTALRRSLLLQARAEDWLLTLVCALARQCFINEYVWPTAPDEDERIAELAATLEPASASAHQLAMLGAYLPLHSLAFAEQLLARQWPAPFEDLITQQIREPAAERNLRASIPKLTVIEDAVSLKVQAQYEDNPYPRWTRIAGGVEPTALDDYLRQLFPTSAFTPHGEGPLDILVAGCGTGWQATGIAQKFKGAKVLAIDLSLSSLAYAKRSTPASLASRIDYAQADILKLGALDRRFGLIEASGVLHHMAQPLAGWRILLGLLKPGGFMHLAFYSELGRREIVAARDYVQGKGYGASAADIRRARQDLLASPHAALARFNDFFSTSECRDMLMHVEEHRLTIPVLKQFIADHELKFIGFEFNQATQERMRALFAQYRWPLTDLDRWHETEGKYPDTFTGMYHLWVQKPAAAAR